MVVVWMLSSLFASTYRLVFIEFGCQVVVGRKVAHPITVDLLWVADGSANHEHEVDQSGRPRGSPTAPVNKDVLKGLELMPGSLLQSEGDLVIDIVIEIVISPHCLLHLVAKVYCFPEDSSDLLQKLGKSNIALLSLFMSVYEQHQHLLFTIKVAWLCS